MDTILIARTAHIALRAGALVMVGLALYCTKKQNELDASIDQSLQQIKADQRRMAEAYVAISSK